MQSTIDKMKWAFVGLFVLIVGGLWTYELVWVRPARECEARGRWWAAEYRACAIPVRLSAFTGKPDAPIADGGAPTAPAPASSSNEHAAVQHHP